MRFSFIIICIVLSFFSVLSQNKLSTTDEKALEHKALGDKYEQAEEFYLAAQEYLKSAKLKPHDPYVDFMLAECYRKNFDYDDAEKWYEKVYAMHNAKYPLAQFWVGMMQKTNGKYIEAEKTLDIFAKTFKPVTAEDKSKLKEAEFEYKGCLYAIDHLKRPMIDNNFKLLPPPVNSKNTDYAPMLFFHDSSIVITSSRADAKGTEMNLATGEARCDNFRFEKNGEKWLRHHNEDNFDIVNTTKDDGAGELTKDKLKYYYTICDPDCGIYVSKKVKGKFTKGVKLNKNINSPGFWNAQPTISPTSDTMFFVSKRPGGKGQHDIWMTINKDKSGNTEDWGPAINMSSINTAYIELSPFWDDHSNRIYFASNGHEGFGGLDIYVAKGRKRDSIVNIGLPFNSNRDDFYFTLGKDKGYMVSNRKGGIGLEDIYTFDTKVKESVVGDIPRDSFADAQSVSSFGRIIFADINEPVAGVTVYLKDEAGETIKEAKTNENGEFRFENLPPDKSFKITMNENDPRITTKLDYKVEKKNQGKSTMEVKAIKAEDKNTSDPINTKTQVKKDSKTVERAAKTDQNLLTFNNTGQKERKENSNDAVNPRKSKLTISKFQIKSSTRKPNKTLFENVYFDFNGIELTPAAQKVLDELLKYYGDHKEIQIEIKAYTDGLGDAAYNRQLAEQRGQACYDYLMGRGIDQTALLITPIGASNPIGSNSSFIGRQLNRRVEFSFVGAKLGYEAEAMTYIVEPKMTLYSISRKFNMSVNELKSMNGFTGEDIKAYSTVRVKRTNENNNIAPATMESMNEGKQEYVYKDNQFSPVGSSSPSSNKSESQEGYVIVGNEDTLYSIAKKNSITINQLIELNGIENNRITKGQKLRIR